MKPKTFYDIKEFAEVVGIGHRQLLRNLHKMELKPAIFPCNSRPRYKWTAQQVNDYIKRKS